MNGKRITLSCAVAALVFATGAMASEIYKWTDEDGNVHYEDRPSGAATEQRLDITYSRTDGSAVQRRVESYRDARTARDEAKSVAAAAEKEAADNAAAEAERQQACDRSRARLETYLQARRLYRTGADGERVYLDEEQQAEARRKAEEQIAEFCS